MIRIEATTLEGAYQDAASSLECSVTELKVEIVQSPSSGVLGFFKKNAIIIADRKEKKTIKVEEKDIPQVDEVSKQDVKTTTKVENEITKKVEEEITEVKEIPKEEEVINKKEETISHTIVNDTIVPDSFVNIQDDEDIDEELTYLADYEEDEVNEDTTMLEIASRVKDEINTLFKSICFNIDTIDVKVYDETTLLIEFKGDDAALLIGKEGYRYKALSYMLFNWVNAKYQVQLRLEIAEFLKNQEDSILKYLETVYESIDRDGRAQTKILDGVLIQIALKELRAKYSDKYIVIRSTRDGLKYIIVNDYH